jgi:penicillin-binding protein 2
VLISAVANGGKIHRPQVVDRIEDLYGQVLAEYHSEQMGEANVSQGTLDFIRDALRGAVNEPGGTGGGSALKEFIVSGKTGTAQVIRLPKDFRKGDRNRMPIKLRDHAWFVAFAPFDDPKIAVVVLVEHGGFGGAVAAPIAKKVIQKYLTPESPSALKMAGHSTNSQGSGTQ